MYPMRMGRVNVYLPDDLADEVRRSGLNVSAVAQEALRAALAARRLSDWLDDVLRLPPTGITHEEALTALTAARAELWGEDA